MLLLFLSLIIKSNISDQILFWQDIVQTTVFSKCSSNVNWKSNEARFQSEICFPKNPESSSFLSRLGEEDKDNLPIECEYCFLRLVFLACDRPEVTLFVSSNNRNDHHDNFQRDDEYCFENE